MDLIEKLRTAGLTGNESKVYYELLCKGTLSANNLSKIISMDRTLTYSILNKLIDKGLVSYIVKDKKKYFDAADPNNLLNSIKEKEAYVKNLIPSLKKIEISKESKQEITVYEGKAAVRMFFREFKKHKKTCSFGATGRAYDILYESPALVKELEKIGFSSRIITHPKFKNHPMTQVKNIQTRFLKLKSEATTTIFNDNIVIHTISEKPKIIQIKNKTIAESYQNHFEILWDSSSKK
ncbi:hypothetical protein HN587_04395 [Candidatus Woesearchaeota archaeon]|jgi:sugar-specific transcriptional regulator TrmB|nr:hypothetical protein [Candidatus Woesearchaeota archaeon]